MKKYFKFIYRLLFLFIIFCAFGYLFNLIEKIGDRTGNPYIYWLHLIILILFGILLGFQTFITYRKSNGIWKMNFSRLLAYGLPSLIVGIYPILYYLNISVLLDITSALYPFLSNSMVQTMGLILFGYILITSFYKDIIIGDAI